MRPNTDKIEQEQEAWRIYEKQNKQLLNTYLAALYVLADPVDGTEADISDSRKFIETQSADPVCHVAIISVTKQNATTPYDTDGSSVHVSSIDGASQQSILSVLRPRILHPRYYSLLTGHSGDRFMYGTMCRDFY